MAEMDDDEKGKLFVGGLSWETTQENMHSYFQRYGDVDDCVVMKNIESGRSRGFGFVTFAEPHIVDVVLKSGPHSLDGRTIDPKRCNPRTLQKSKKGTGFPKVFLGGLPSNVTETDLRQFFRRYGKVMEVVIMYDQEKKKSRGFGFLSFDDEASVDRVTGEHYIHLNGKQVEIKKAEPRDGGGAHKKTFSSGAEPPVAVGRMDNGNWTPPVDVPHQIQPHPILAQQSHPVQPQQSYPILPQQTHPMQPQQQPQPKLQQQPHPILPQQFHPKQQHPHTMPQMQQPLVPQQLQPPPQSQYHQRAIVSHAALMPQFGGFPQPPITQQLHAGAQPLNASPTSFDFHRPPPNISASYKPAPSAPPLNSGWGTAVATHFAQQPQPQPIHQRQPQVEPRKPQPSQHQLQTPLQPQAPKHHHQPPQQHLLHKPLKPQTLQPQAPQIQPLQQPPPQQLYQQPPQKLQPPPQQQSPPAHEQPQEQKKKQKPNPNHSAAATKNSSSGYTVSTLASTTGSYQSWGAPPGVMAGAAPPSAAWTNFNSGSPDAAATMGHFADNRPPAPKPTKVITNDGLNNWNNWNNTSANKPHPGETYIRGGGPIGNGPSASSASVAASVSSNGVTGVDGYLLKVADCCAIQGNGNVVNPIGINNGSTSPSAAEYIESTKSSATGNTAHSSVLADNT